MSDLHAEGADSLAEEFCNGRRGEYLIFCVSEPYFSHKAEYGDQERDLDELLKDRDPKTMFSSVGLLGELKKALAERVLNAEMGHHLSDSTQDEVSEGEKPANHRNGYSKKTVLAENEALELSCRFPGIGAAALSRS